MSVLDAGCGHGTWLKKVLDCCLKNRIDVVATGIDLSENRIAIARTHVPQSTSVTLTCDNLRQAALPPRVDLIYSAEVFQHLNADQHAELLQRWLTVLVPGGSVVIIDKDRFSLHSIKAALQKRTGRIGRRLLGVFPKDYSKLFSTIRYPSFRNLAKVGRRMGYSPGLRVVIGQFTSLALVKPAVAVSVNELPTATRRARIRYA
jgi:cyclopropane fatty-acyl-phospholipid synthase-like methyltransferase